MSLLHRQPVHETPEHVRETPEHVPPSPEVEEHHRRVTAEPSRAATGARWLRWVAVALLIAAGAVVLAVVVGGDEGPAITDQGPNVGVAEVWTIDTPPVVADRGPNPDLAVVWTTE